MATDCRVWEVGPYEKGREGEKEKGSERGRRRVGTGAGKYRASWEKGSGGRKPETEKEGGREGAREAQGEREREMEKLEE